MNNFTYAVVNADIPVIYARVRVHIYVKYAVGLSVRRAI
jgi:hypothetical protein